MAILSSKAELTNLGFAVYVTRRLTTCLELLDVVIPYVLLVGEFFVVQMTRFFRGLHNFAAHL